MSLTEASKGVDGLNLSGQVPSSQSPFSRKENGRKAGIRGYMGVGKPSPYAVSELKATQIFT